MSEYIVDLSEVKQTSDRFRFLFQESILLGEEIVRCRDCRHYHESINGCDEFGDIWHDEFAVVDPNGFCKWGERRDA